MREPLFRIGDEVRIKPREGDSSDYRFSYADSMTRYAGLWALITSVVPANTAYSHYVRKDDGFKYKLNIGDADYNWASSMLEPIGVNPDIINPNTIPKGIEKVINIKLKPVEKIKFNFKN